ncbi:hypothetical protein C8R42DRAFT_708418 [Lentinula raphanica]|nr:hypothetical protein C8R42DRAFT_708418 [Lentinula raphanica]
MTRSVHIRVLPLGILLLSSLMSTISPEVLAAPTSVSSRLRRGLGRDESIHPEVSGVLPHPVEARGGSAGAGAGGSRSEEVEVKHENHVPPQEASKELYDELKKLVDKFHRMASELEGADKIEQEDHRLLRYKNFCVAHQEDIRSMHDQASRIRDEAAKAGDESLKGFASDVVHHLDQYLEAFETPAEEGKNEEVKNR